MFQVLNLTELELNRVDIRVGLSGALYYMDGSPQAIRQLRNLVSQVFFPALEIHLGFCPFNFPTYLYTCLCSASYCIFALSCSSFLFIGNLSVCKIVVLSSHSHSLTTIYP